MTEAALQKLGASSMDELIDAILPLSDNFEAPSTYCRVSKVVNLTIHAVANSAVEIPLSEVANLHKLKSMNVSKPWEALINSGDIARYLFTLQRYRDITSPFLQAQFFHIMLPSLDRHFTSHLDTSVQINEVMQYLSYLKTFLQTWFRTSAHILVQVDTFTGSKELGLTQEQVVTQSYHIVFHLLKKLFSIAQKAIYGNGYQVNAFLNQKKREDKDTFCEGLIDGLQVPIVDFLSTEAMPWSVLGELLNQLIPLFPLSYKAVNDLAIVQLFQYIESTAKIRINDTLISILVQVYNTQVQPTKRKALSHLLSIITQTLDSASVQGTRTLVWMLVALVRYNETDWSQSEEIYGKFPFGRITAYVGSLDESTRKCVLETLTLPTVANHFIKYNSDYSNLIRSLLTVESIEHLIDLRKWKNIETLVLNKLTQVDFLHSGQLEITLFNALFKNMPPQLLPLFDVIPIKLLSDLHSYFKCFQEDNRTTILEHLCMHARNRYSLIEIMAKEEDTLYPEWGQFSKTCARQLTRSLLLWVLEKTRLRLRFCPKMLMFDIASQYL